MVRSTELRVSGSDVTGLERTGEVPFPVRPPGTPPERSLPASNKKGAHHRLADRLIPLGLRVERVPPSRPCASRSPRRCVLPVGGLLVAAVSTRDVGAPPHRRGHRRCPQTAELAVHLTAVLVRARGEDAPEGAAKLSATQACVYPQHEVLAPPRGNREQVHHLALAARPSHECVLIVTRAAMAPR